MKYQIPDIIISDDELSEKLLNIDKIITDLNKRKDKGLSKEANQRLLQKVRIKEIYHSNAIEGNSLDLRETEIILDGLKVRNKPIKDVLEAKSLSSAVDYLHEIISGSQSLDKRTLLDLHSLIIKPINPEYAGKYRDNEASITYSDHVPPPFLELDKHMNVFFKFINTNRYNYHTLIMGAIIHHWLTWIHPFADGNGRTARLFLNFYFIQKNYPTITIKKDNREQYYSALKKADNGNHEEMIIFFEKNMRDAIDNIESFINQEKRQEEWKTRFKDKHLKSIEKEKKKWSYEYEVWIQQMNIFKTHLSKVIEDASYHLKYYDFSIEEYDLSLEKYLDILEDKKVYNKWYLKLRIRDFNNMFGISFIFYASRFAPNNIFPRVKLNIFTRIDDTGKSEPLLNDISLRSIGYDKDQLIFGVLNRENKKGVTIINKIGNSMENINLFIDEVLETYFDI